MFRLEFYDRTTIRDRMCLIICNCLHQSTVYDYLQLRAVFSITLSARLGRGDELLTNEILKNSERRDSRYRKDADITSHNEYNDRNGAQLSDSSNSRHRTDVISNHGRHSDKNGAQSSDSNFDS